MRSFDTTSHPGERTLLQPMHGFFGLGKRDRIFTTRVLTRLEALQTIRYDRQQHFVCQSVDAVFRDRTILEMDRLLVLGDSGLTGTAVRDLIHVVGITVPAKIHRLEQEGVVGWIDDMIVNRSGEVCQTDEFFGGVARRFLRWDICIHVVFCFQG